MEYLAGIENGFDQAACGSGLVHRCQHRNQLLGIVAEFLESIAQRHMAKRPVSINGGSVCCQESKRRFFVAAVFYEMEMNPVGKQAVARREAAKNLPTGSVRPSTSRLSAC